MIENLRFPAPEDLLSLALKRKHVLAANVANVDTPGYRAQDYRFEDQLALSMQTTSEKHISGLGAGDVARLYEVGTAERPDGNNVDIERERTEITKNDLHYETLVQFLNQKIRTLRSAITEGGKF